MSKQLFSVDNFICTCMCCDDSPSVYFHRVSGFLWNHTHPWTISLWLDQKQILSLQHKRALLTLTARAWTWLLPHHVIVHSSFLTMYWMSEACPLVFKVLVQFWCGKHCIIQPLQDVSLHKYQKGRQFNISYNSYKIPQEKIFWCISKESLLLFSQDC